MKQYFRAMSHRAEFTAVILTAFGYFMLGSILSLLTPSSGAPISEAGLRFLLVYEALAIVALGAFLAVRGWRLQQLGFAPTLRDTGICVALAVIAYVAYAAIWLIFSSYVPSVSLETSSLVSADLRVLTVLAVAVVNPVFEEIFVCGYLIVALRTRRSVSFSINVSVGVRLVYHLYQGPVGVISIIPLGLVFAHWFAKTGRLWPVVVAHAIFDLIGLLAYAQL